MRNSNCVNRKYQTLNYNHIEREDFFSQDDNRHDQRVSERINSHSVFNSDLSPEKGEANNKNAKSLARKMERILNKISEKESQSAVPPREKSASKEAKRNSFAKHENADRSKPSVCKPIDFDSSFASFKAISENIKSGLRKIKVETEEDEFSFKLSLHKPFGFSGVQKEAPNTEVGDTVRSDEHRQVQFGRSQQGKNEEKRNLSTLDESKASSRAHEPSDSGDFIRPKYDFSISNFEKQKHAEAFANNSLFKVLNTKHKTPQKMLKNNQPVYVDDTCQGATELSETFNKTMRMEELDFGYESDMSLAEIERAVFEIHSQNGSKRWVSCSSFI